MTYSLLIPTCNRPNLVKRLLNAVEAQTLKPSEVVLIDQSDDKATEEAFKTWTVEGVAKKYIHRTVKSLILARHAGLDASGDFDLVAFFDDDIVPETKFSEEIIRIFENDSAGRYGGGMGKVMGSVMNRQSIFQSFFLMPRDGDGSFQASGAPTFPHWRDQFCETEFLSGGCTFWRRDIIRQYRYDERLTKYGHGDDVDVSYRVSRDYKLFFQPTALCQHDEHSPGRDRRRIYRKSWIQNMYYLAQKNKIGQPAYFRCVLGHILRDSVLFDIESLKGDFDAIANIARGRIDTVDGYDEFKKQK